MEGRHGTQTGKAAKLKPGDSVGSTPTRATRGLLGWCSSRRPVKPLSSSVRRKAEGSTPSPPTGGSRRRPVRLSAGHQPLKLTRRVRFPHGPLDDSPSGGTGRRASLRTSCPRGVGVRISPWRLNPLQAGRCPAGPHKPGVPGSIPGPGTRGWAGARPSFIRSEAEVRLPDPQLSVFMARYANWHRGQVESLVPVGSNPTRATARKLVPSSSGEDACLTHRIAQVRVLPGRLSAGRSAGVPAAHLLGREGDRVRFSGGPSWERAGDLAKGSGASEFGSLPVHSPNGLLVQRDDAGIARRRSGFDSPAVH